MAHVDLVRVSWRFSGRLVHSSEWSKSYGIGSIYCYIVRSASRGWFPGCPGSCSAAMVHGVEFVAKASWLAVRPLCIWLMARATFLMILA